MPLPTNPAPRTRPTFLLTVAVTTLLLAFAATAKQRKANVDPLLIGTSGSFDTEGEDPKKEQSALQTLKAFIKDETGFNSEIAKQKNWIELANKMAKGDLHLGVFQGYEYAWAQQKYADFKPLAIAVNVHRYPVACVVAKGDHPAKSFGDLKGQSFGMTANGDRYLNLFVEQQCKTQGGQNPKTFFSKVVTLENVEDLLDNVFEGTVHAAVADQTALDGYQRRKPGRFAKLKEVMRSRPFPPAIVVAYGTVLDDATLNRFQEGLLNANKKERGQMVLTLFHVTGFEKTPEDFDKVLADTMKTYPPTLGPGK